MQQGGTREKWRGGGVGTKKKKAMRWWGEKRQEGGGTKKKASGGKNNCKAGRYIVKQAANSEGLNTWLEKREKKTIRKEIKNGKTIDSERCRRLKKKDLKDLSMTREFSFWVHALSETKEVLYVIL